MVMMMGMVMALELVVRVLKEETPVAPAGEVLELNAMGR